MKRPASTPPAERPQRDPGGEEAPRTIEIDAVLPPEGVPGPGSGPAPVSPGSRFLAYLLDDAVRVPGTRFRIGLDPIVGFLFPGIGDALGAAVGSAILGDALRKGVPRKIVARMGLNLFLNSTLGSVPILGDLFSAWFKSNAQNYALLVRHTSNPHHPLVRPSWWPVLLVLLLTLAAIAGTWVITILAARAIAEWLIQVV